MNKPSLSEQLAVAHADGTQTGVVMAAGFSPELGGLLHRWIYNGDQEARLRAKAVISMRVLPTMLGDGNAARRAVSRVLGHMRDERCMICLGRGMVPQANAVMMPCSSETCDDGKVSVGVGWAKSHHRIKRMADEALRVFERGLGVAFYG